MGESRIAFVAITLLFCSVLNGSAQQYENYNTRSHSREWEPTASRLRNRPRTRSVAPSPYPTPIESSPAVNTRARQPFRRRTAPDPYAFQNPQDVPVQLTDIRQKQPHDVIPTEYPTDNFRTTQQRVKTLEDSLNTERYQRRGERPLPLRRSGPADQPEDPQLTEFPSPGRRSDVGVESPVRRVPRPRSRLQEDRRSSDAEEAGVPLADITQTAPPRSRGSFRGRTTFQDTSAPSEAPKRSRTRGFTSRYQNVEPTAGYTEISRGGAPVAQAQPVVTALGQGPGRTFGSTVQQFPASAPQYIQQFPAVDQLESVTAAIPNAQPQLIEANKQPSRAKTDAIFPNLSTQQFSTDPSQFARSRADSLVQTPAAQQFPLANANQQQRIPAQNQQVPLLEPNVGAAFPDVPLTNQPSDAPDQFLRRIDSNDAERTPQFIPIESPKPRNNVRSRGRTVPTARDFDATPEAVTQRSEPSRGSTRSRQGSFRSRTRVYSPGSTEAPSTTPPPPRQRAPSRVSQSDKENAPPRRSPFRGRARIQTVEASEAPQPEAKERSFTEVSEAVPEVPAAPATQTPVASPAPIAPLAPSRSSKPFRGTVTAKVSESHSEDDIDATANYPKEFLDKLKSSKGFVPPPKRPTRLSQRAPQGPPGNSDPGNRLKRRQYVTTETYSSREPDVSESAPKESSQAPEAVTARGTKERYSQRFYKRLSGKSGRPRPTEEPEAKRAATTEADVSTTEQASSGEERRKFVPKKKLTLEERKQRIARLKEKLRKNATDEELKTEESKESVVVRESLQVQANTHPGSREVYLTETKPSSSPKTSRGHRKGQVRFQDEDTSSKYDLITLGSEENVQSVFVGKREGPPTTTTRPTATTTTTTTTSTTRAPPTSTEPATQVPASTTLRSDFNELNVTLFPSTRHRFSARINSTSNLSLPPDVELITTTPAPTAPGRNPDTLSVNELFNASLSTTSTTSASVTKATSRPKPSTPATPSPAPNATARNSSATTKRPAAKKKSSGRKKPKKSKSKSSANRTTTKKPTTAKPPTAATVRTPADTPPSNASNSNATGAVPLPLAFSDIQAIINETIKVVNSNPMTGPSPALAPRSELDALTPETILNATETTTAANASVETTTPSATNSSGNSTNRPDTPGRLTSQPECLNGSCTSAESQSLRFNGSSSNSSREPLPYARARGTTKRPDALRKIFIYGLFPNNTVQKRPFPDHRPSLSTPPPTTSADYYVFGVYPNNSVVRRRGWKTFDYERYHSPYVIFGIYPNNTIVKKYPNGTTINDEFMVSDNEIRRTPSDGKPFRGCTCANGIHDHATTPLTTSSTSTTTAPTTTTSTTTTTAAPTTTASSPTTTEETTTEEPGTEEPERNAKDDAESIEIQSGNISETEPPGENSTMESSGTTTEEEEEAEEEEEEEEEETEGPTESTTEQPATTAQSAEMVESTTQSFQGSLAEAEEADMVSTPGSVEDSTSRGTEEPEDLENAEEADDASTPRSLDDVTSSLEREETQNVGGGGGGGSLADAEDRDTNESTESSGGLNEAEEADDARTTERSENVEERTERTTAQTDVGTTESVEGRTTERSETENIEESTTAKGTVEETTEGGTTARSEAEESFASIEERTTARNEVEGTTTARNEVEETIEDFGESTTARNEIEESTTGRSEVAESTTGRSEVAESTTARQELEGRTTVRNEAETIGSVEERTTTTRNEVEEGTTGRNEMEGTFGNFEERTTVRSEIDESTTARTEVVETIGSLEEPTTTARSEIEPTVGNLEERTTARSEIERTESVDERTTVRNEIDRIESIDERTTATNEVEDSTSSTSENSESGADMRTTERNGNAQEVTTERSFLELPTTELSDRAVGNVEESTTEGLEKLISNSIQEATESERIREQTTLRSQFAEERQTGSEGLSETTTAQTENPEESFPDVGTTARSENLESQTTARVQSELETTTEKSSQPETTEATTARNENLEDRTFGQNTETTTETRSQLQQLSLVTTDGSTPQTTEPIFIGDLFSKEPTTPPTPQQTDTPTNKPSSDSSLIIDLNSDVTTAPNLLNEDISEVNLLKDIAAGRTQNPDENTVPTTQQRLENLQATTAPPVPANDEHFQGYFYDKPAGGPVNLYGFFDEHFAANASNAEDTTDAVEPVTDSATTTDYDIDIRELGNLIGRLTTGIFSEHPPTTTSTATTPPPQSDATSDDLLNALLPITLEYLQASSTGNSLRKRHRRAVDDLDEPSSLTKLAYRALSSAETAPPPLLTTTTTATPTATTTRTKHKKTKNLSKTTVTAYKNLTTLSATPRPDDVFIVTPVSSTRDTSDYFRRGKVKFVTLTPGVVVTTNIHDHNDILTMSSQHVQKVTKAPAKIPDNFLSTVFGELEEKASSPIPDILKNAENELQGDGLSASLARRIITLALEKAMTSTTPPVTPQSVTATTPPTSTNPASYIQRITTPEPTTTTTTFQTTPTTTTTTTTTKKPSTTRKPRTTTKKPTTTPKPKPKTTTTTSTTTTTTTTPKPTTTTTETPRTILITPKKASPQQLKSSAAAITSPEFLASTPAPPAISDSQNSVHIDPLTVLFSGDNPHSSSSSTTTTPSSQRVTEDLNLLLSGLWQEQTSTTTERPETSSRGGEGRKKSSKSKSALSKQASASLSESDLKILEAILQQQGAGGPAQDLEQIVQNQIRLAEEVRKASRNLKKKPRTTTTTTTAAPPTPLGLGFLLNLFGAGSRPNGLFSNEQRNSRRQRPVLSSLTSLNASNVTPDPFNELDEGNTTGERSARGELVSAAIDVTKAVSKFMGTVLTSAAQSFQNFFRNLGR